MVIKTNTNIQNIWVQVSNQFKVVQFVCEQTCFIKQLHSPLHRQHVQFFASFEIFSSDSSHVILKVWWAIPIPFPTKQFHRNTRRSCPRKTGSALLTNNPMDKCGPNIMITCASIQKSHLFSITPYDSSQVPAHIFPLLECLCNREARPAGKHGSTST